MIGFQVLIQGINFLIPLFFPEFKKKRDLDSPNKDKTNLEINIPTPKQHKDPYIPNKDMYVLQSNMDMDIHAPK